MSTRQRPRREGNETIDRWQPQRCRHCGKEIYRARPGRRYCDRYCRLRARRKRWRKYRGQRRRQALA